MAENSKRTFKIVSISILLLAMVWQHIQATRLGYAVENSRRQARILKSRIGSLQMELETSLSPAQLTLRAGSLGMVPAPPQSLRILGAS